VLAVEPDATGPAVMLFEAAKTIVRSFVEAAVTAVLAVAVLLWMALRRIVDVLLTLVPLLLAATVTLELCSAFNIPLNLPTSSRCRCCSSSASRSRFATLWLGAAARLMGPPRTRPSRSEPAFEPPQETVPSRRPEAEMVDR
jgi:hypothetical protein